MRYLLLLLTLLLGCQSPPPPVKPKTTHRVMVMAFTASWCGPCQEDKPKLSELRKRKGTTVAVVDIDKSKGLASVYRISRVPTYVVLIDDREVTRTNRIEDIIYEAQPPAN